MELGESHINRNRSDADYSRIKVNLLYKKKISINFYEMISWDLVNCLDCRDLGLINRDILETHKEKRK